MASKENATVLMVDVHQLATVIRTNRLDNVLIVDSRSFLEYNDRHITGAVNVCCSKLVKRRLQQDKVSVRDLLLHSCNIERGLDRVGGTVDENGDVIVYDQLSINASSVSPDSFLHVLLSKLVHGFRRVFLLSGGFLEFQASYGDLCEDKTRLMRTALSSATACLTSLSQPCLPTTNVGPTRILPFLYLGSQQDAHNRPLLADYNITYEVNVSTNCPQPDFIQDNHFLRLPVNDSYGEKLLPYFVRATQFIDKVRETNGSVLVHCLAGISRSPTVAIAYVMRHLQMTFDDAFRYVKSKRTSISPNFNFLGQLLEYERQLRAEEVLTDDMACLQQQQPPSAPIIVSPGVCRDRLSRSVSLSLSLKPPSLLETVPHSCSPSPDDEPPLDQVDGGAANCRLDLSPTTALARLSFEAMETSPEAQQEHQSSSYLMVSRRKHTREESYRSLRQRLSSSTTTTSSSSESSHFFTKQKTSSSSHVVLTVSQSKRVTTNRKPPPSPSSTAPSTADHCSEISVQIDNPAAVESVEIRTGGARRSCSGSLFTRPHSDGNFRRLPLRRPSYAPSEASSCVSDEMIPTPLSPTTSMSSSGGSGLLLSPSPWASSQTGLYARSDSVTTSGLGSEISDSDTRADCDAMSLCSGSTRCEAEPDDGVFTEPPPPPPPPMLGLRSTRPRPSSLLGIVPVVNSFLPLHISQDEPNESSQQRPPRPTSLSTGSSSFNFSMAPPPPFAGPNDPSASGEELPDSATVFRLWRQREAAIEHDRSELAMRRRSRELTKSLQPSGLELITGKRKSSEGPQEDDDDDDQTAPKSAAVVEQPTPSSSSGEKRRSTRDANDDSPGEEAHLYRVKSCPQIKDELLEEPMIADKVQLRVRPVSSPRQRYSCGTLDHRQIETVTPIGSNTTSPCGSNQSLNCNGRFSFIEVS